MVAAHPTARGAALLGQQSRDHALRLEFGTWRGITLPCLSGFAWLGA